jgi:hypothetical protein
MVSRIPLKHNAMCYDINTPQMVRILLHSRHEDSGDLLTGEAQVYLWAGPYKFKVMSRKDLEANMAQVRLSARETNNGVANSGGASSGLTNSASLPSSDPRQSGNAPRAAPAKR